MNQRVKLNPVSRSKLSKHKKLLRDLSNRSTSLKKKGALVQSGGFASLIPLLIGPVLTGLSTLLRR